MATTTSPVALSQPVSVKSPKIVRTVLACVACAFAATACGSAAAGGPAVYEVRAIAISGLGRILADGAGRTLYLYAPDHQGPSTCSAGCLIGWPPLVLARGVTRPSCQAQGSIRCCLEPTGALAARSR